jgi:hypothetical protein
MPRSLPLVALALLLAPGEARAQTTSATRVGSDSLHHLIASFLAEPIKYGSMYREIIDSAEKSPLVKVTISAGVAPWMCELPKESSVARAMQALFFAAFIAGDMRAQLESGVKGDQPVAGVLAVLGVYEQAKLKVMNLDVPTMERWIELRRQGTLDAEVRAIAAHPPKGCTKPAAPTAPTKPAAPSAPAAPGAPSEPPAEPGATQPA